jgi:hypothetical protein
MRHMPNFFITAVPTTWQVKGQVITAINTTNATGPATAILQADCFLSGKDLPPKDRTFQIRQNDILLHPNRSTCNFHLLSHDVTTTETAMEKGTSANEV